MTGSPASSAGRGDAAEYEGSPGEAPDLAGEGDDAAGLYIVSTPIGNLADVTQRARSVLGTVDLVLAEDTRRTGILMQHLDLSTPLRSLHAHNEASRIDEILERLARGQSLALVSDSGTPLISDPGERLVAAAAEAGHRVIPVPGASALLAAFVASGFSTEGFVFLGFPPRRGSDRSRVLGEVADEPRTVILYESPERLVRLLGDLGEVCGPERRVVVGRELTKLHEELKRGTITEVLRYYEAHPPRGEIVVVVEGSPTDAGPDEVDEAAAEALARALLEQGMRPSRASREVARRLGIPRNLAYDLVHSLE